MSWTHALAAGFAGALLGNTVPHFVHGISGDRFPTPFAHPPGKGLSSPAVNMLWALVNLAAGGLLFRLGGVARGGAAALGSCFAGVALIGILSSLRFAHKDPG